MKVLAFLLAGGKGTRLSPLVNERCKPAVPFGGRFRIIDFTLSNCINSGIRRVNVMVQYQSESLQKHIRDGWSILSSYLGEYIDVYPPQQRVSDHMYTGTADAVYQNLYTIEVEKPDYILILGGDHIYKMDYRHMIRFHLEKGAALTVAAVPVPISEAVHFGIIVMDKKYQVLRFQEKPKENAATIPDDPNTCLASMGIYVFSTEIMKKYLMMDSQKTSDHDFGKNIIPDMLENNESIYVFPFRDKDGNPGYWKDVGTLSAYYQTNMEMLSEESPFQLDDPKWKIRTYEPYQLPAQIMSKGSVNNSLISGGVKIYGKVKNSILSGKVIVEEGATVEDSIIFDNAIIGKQAQVQRAILDKDVVIPPSYILSKEHLTNEEQFTITEDHVIVLPKGARLS